MTTHCTSNGFEFQRLGMRRVVASFDGGEISSDGGGLLLREVERRRGLVKGFAACFVDHREQSWVEHSVEELVGQRVYGLALGYEDLNDHDTLCRDPLLATVVGKEDPTGQERKQEPDRGQALASKPTLHRLEWGVAVDPKTDRYRRIALDSEAVDRFFVQSFLSAYEEPPDEIVLDFDATDDPLHGQQEGRFFHGYYGHYCYLPLYVFCGDHLLCARLRRANQDASAGSVEELERIVGQIREVWPEVEIVVRGDSGFAREKLMSWCEADGVDFIFGMARNSRLEEKLEPAFERAEKLRAAAEEEADEDEEIPSVRVYEDFSYSTRKSWSRERRMIGKAEITPHGRNPRFVVTSLPAECLSARQIYEDGYCPRGEMENRIKEQQLCLFADRTSARDMAVNQVRLWLSSLAYLLLSELRRLGLAGTDYARARCDTIRLRLLKIGVHVRLSVRRVALSLSSSYPLQALFARVYRQLQRAGPLPA